MTSRILEIVITYPGQSIHGKITLRKEAHTGKATMRCLDPDEFDTLLRETPTILDCQPNVHDYIRQHIPGAVYVNEESVRLTSRGMPHVWIPDEMARLLFRQLGVSNDRPVAVYGSRGIGSAGDGMSQMVMAYTLLRYGHKDVSILDGGLERWKEESLPVTQVATMSQKGDFQPFTKRGLSSSTKALERALADRASLVIDTRLPELYQGESGFPKPGHIPGAVNLPWTELVMPDNPCRLRDKTHLCNCLERVGVRSGKKVITYCATGRKSAALFNIMRFLLHHRDVRLYEGSFTEWCADPKRKTVTGPDPWPG